MSGEFDSLIFAELDGNFATKQDERWLRPEKRRAWLGMKNSVVPIWIATPFLVSLNSVLPTGWGLHLAGPMLFCWCVPMPAWVLIKRLAYWSFHRSLVWHIDAAGIKIYRHGAVVHRYDWSQVIRADSAYGEAISIRTGDAWKKHQMRLVRPEDVRWFREYARDRLAERPSSQR